MHSCCTCELHSWGTATVYTAYYMDTVAWIVDNCYVSLFAHVCVCACVGVSTCATYKSTCTCEHFVMMMWISRPHMGWAANGVGEGIHNMQLLYERHHSPVLSVCKDPFPSGTIDPSRSELNFRIINCHLLLATKVVASWDPSDSTLVTWRGWNHPIRNPGYTHAVILTSENRRFLPRWGDSKGKVSMSSIALN